MKKRNEDNPENLGGLGDLVPAEVLKKLNELLELLHQSGDTNHSTTVINYYAEGSWHVDNSTIGTVNNNNGDCSHAFEGHFPTPGKTATKEMMSRAARITLDGGYWKSQRSWSVAFVVYCIWGYKGRVSDFLTEVDGWPDGVADRMACNRDAVEKLKNTYYFSNDVLGCVYLYQNLTTAVHQCEDALFGQLLQDMYDNEARDTLLRRVYDKTAKFYSLLPEEFTTQDVIKTWGYSRIDSASKKIADLIKNNQVEKVKKGSYKKLATAI